MRETAGFPNNMQMRQELEQQRRVEQLEQARQMNQISPGARMCGVQYHKLLVCVM